MTKKTEIEQGLQADGLEPELKRQLRDIEIEEQPERLLALARKLQTLLREKERGGR